MLLVLELAPTEHPTDRRPDDGQRMAASMIRVPDQRLCALRLPGPTSPEAPAPQRRGVAGRPGPGVFCASVIAIATIGAAHAQTLPTRSAPPDAQVYDRDIVVTARRDAADDPETELSEEDIARYGANTIADLLHAVAPLIDGTGKPPVLLVNGKRIGGASGIAGFPPEALTRLAILPPAAAARLGYAADQRVVNLVLKNKFASWEGEVGATLATAGGRDSERALVSRVVIDGPTYWNAQVQLSRDSMLFRSARALPSRSDPVDLGGHVTGTSGQEIDSALSLIAGRKVTIVDFPSGAPAQSPTLADFAVAAARDIRFSDPDAAYALLPDGRSMSANLGVTSPLGSFTGSLNANFSTNSSIQRLGYPSATLTLPAGSPWSPFGRDVLLVPDLTVIGPLETRQNTKTLGLSASLTGTIGGWNANLLANYTRSWADSSFDRGLDLRAIQNRLDALDPSFNPYAPLPGNVVEVDRSRSRFAAADAKLILDRTLVKLQAGPLTANLSVGVNRMTLSSDSDGDPSAPATSTDLKRTQVDVRASLAAPLTRRGQGPLAGLGDLSANVAIGATMMSGSQTQRQFDASLTWSPARAVQFYGGYSFAQVVPDIAQLNGPRIETVVQIYDPVRQAIAKPVWIIGGNPDLRKGTRSSLTLKATWRPLGRSLTLDLGYQRQVARGGTAAFPQLTPAVEAAFPGRITRDASGSLIAVDARPINIARDLGEQLTTGLTWLWSPATGPTPARKPSSAPWQITFTINHSWQLQSLLTTDPALPPLDRLGGDGGQPRHIVSMQLMAGRSGLGAMLNGQWQNATRVDNAGVAGGQGELRYSALSQFNLSLFVEPANLASGGNAAKTWASNLRISIDLQNLLDSWQRVTAPDGSIAKGYDRYALNPLGRTIQVTMRKRF